MIPCARIAMRNGLGLLKDTQWIYPLKIGTSTTIRSYCVYNYYPTVLYKHSRIFSNEQSNIYKIKIKIIIMKFIVIDTYGYCGHVMPENRFVREISKVYKTQIIPFKYFGKDRECFIVEINDLNSLMKFKSIVDFPIIIGIDLVLPDEIENQADSTILIYDGYIE